MLYNHTNYIRQDKESQIGDPHGVATNNNYLLMCWLREPVAECFWYAGFRSEFVMMKLSKLRSCFSGKILEIMLSSS